MAETIKKSGRDIYDVLIDGAVVGFVAKLSAGQWQAVKWRPDRNLILGTFPLRRTAVDEVVIWAKDV